ncbi:MAG: TorF family putative porin [Brevundimonas sp.]|uniref:TorF family putative porin n=1 Tax=Brevundimonas sp. TaxID=1871086 RepID=UPI0040338717
MIRTATLAAAALALFAGSAHAQEAAGNWSFGLGAATDNRSKDASKSDGEPFVWGEAQWSNASGFFYAGPAFETIKASTGSDLEVSLVAGIRPQLAGFDLDISAEHKWHVDANPGADDEAWEFTADISRSIGPASARVRVQHSPDSTGSTEAWTWVALRGGWDFTNKLKGTAEIGRREQDNSIDYTGWNVGVSYALTDAIEADLRWHATDADVPGEQYKDGLVAGIAFAF